MSENSAVSAAVGEENDSAIPSEVTSLMETLAPSVADRFGSGNFAVVAGGVSLFRAYRSYKKGDRKRAMLRAVVGLFWAGVAIAQRRGRSGSGPDASTVVDTSPDVEEAADPGERDTDHATGEEVVNTTDADLDESDVGDETGMESETDESVSADTDSEMEFGGDVEDDESESAE